MYKMLAMGLLSCFAGGVLLIFCGQDSYRFLACLAFGLSVMGGMFIGAVVLMRMNQHNCGIDSVSTNRQTSPHRHTTGSNAF